MDKTMFDAVKKMFGGKGHIDVKKVEEAITLGEMELVQFEFYPMTKKVEPHYETVNIKSIKVTEDGIYVTFSSKVCDAKDYGSYVGKIDCRNCGFAGFTGVFYTRDEAEQCFKDTMAKWKANIP